MSMSKMQLRQLGFIYIGYGLFTKNKKRIPKI